MRTAPPDPAPVLAGLKDFQRRTVEYAFRRLYTDQDPTRRLLIADEVGLGKTLVARGLIAKAVDHLWNRRQRIDVVYVCSNADIARQNVRRLRLSDEDDFALATRITLLPIALRHLGANRLNFVSLTPGTSLEQASLAGLAQERALILHLLRRCWEGIPELPALRVMRAWCGLDSFRGQVRCMSDEHIDEALAGAFATALTAGQREWFDRLCERFRYVRDDPPGPDRHDQVRLISSLRATLARVCVTALEPDLVILDEFQRFSHLLSGDDAAAELARELFSYSDERGDVRVLLLSATPYRMYSLAAEGEGDDHYRDFLRTVAFLHDDEARTAALARVLDGYRSALYRLPDAEPEVLAARGELEERLRRVVVRTERLAASTDRDGLLVDAGDDGVRLRTEEVESFLDLADMALAVGSSDALEYWKSSPYPLSFMDDYALKRSVIAALDRGEERVAEIIGRGRSLLPWSRVRRYRAVEPGNARARALVDDTVGRGLWRLLWMPAALPEWQPRGAFADPVLHDATKRLVFSSWRMVPKAIAALLSYEAERLMMRAHERHPQNTPRARRRRRALLNFAVDQSEGAARVAGMPVLALLNPSPALAELADRALEGGDAPSADGAVARVAALVRPELADLGARTREHARADEAWYWAAPLLLDARRQGGRDAWLEHPELAGRWSGRADGDQHEESSHFAEHLRLAAEAAAGRHPLGPAPNDLADVVARLALAAPGTAMLRALATQAGGRGALGERWLRDAAANGAWGLRTLLNLPESMALVRGLRPELAYWRACLEYCLDGNLPAVLGEYAHLLREALGLFDRPARETAAEIAAAIRSAAEFHASRLEVDVAPSGRSSRIAQEHMRGRFARRFDRSTSETAEVTPRERVREAFNSPFWPFVLATTSVGQEGLDFHHYCHAVVHWNLPSNPVDLEQREGRVHRFKNHAVRKNLARRYGRAPVAGAVDPWAELFAAGARERPAGTTDLVPFWVYPARGDRALDGRIARIERHVPALPLSRDAERYGDLRRSLAVYRMVFGQPRQEDLLRFLLERLGEERARWLLDRLRIDLEPPPLPEVAEVMRGE